ncbi:MAG: hypothetical protein ABI400_08305 [Lacisediminihabitans sp.]
MPDVKIDLTLLSKLQSELHDIATEFSRAEAMSQTVGGYVGHGGLEHVVHDFASKWNVHREKIEEKLTFVQESSKAVHDTFVELDRRLTVQAEILGDGFTAQPNVPTDFSATQPSSTTQSGAK